MHAVLVGGTTVRDGQLPPQGDITWLGAGLGQREGERWGDWAFPWRGRPAVLAVRTGVGGLPRKPQAAFSSALSL